MELRLDMELLYERKPQLAAFREIIDKLGLQELMHADVSVMRALRGLSGWMANGEVNCGIAFAMYGLFVVAAPVLDMLALLVVAACSGLCKGSAPRGGVPRRAMAFSRVLGKLSMLDVSIMGTVVIVLSLSNMKKNGVSLSLNYGTLALFGAEVCHYTTSHIVRRLHEGASSCLEENPPAQGKLQNTGDTDDNSENVFSDVAV